MSRSAGGFAEKTILAVVSVLKDTVSNEVMAGKRGLLQRLDPRAKCACFALLLASVLVTRSIPLLAVFCVAVVLLAVLSSIPVPFFLKRTLLFIPLFAFCIAVPALFHVVTPGAPIISFKIFSHELAITRQGLSSATIFLLRVFVSVSIGVLLVLTTRHSVLLKSLRVFRVPKVFVMTMGMTYRYIFLLLDIVQNTFTAIRSRAGFIISSRTGRRIVAANAAGLWLRSYRLQSQVYDAMLSRGYTGESLVLDDFRARGIDFSALVISGTVFIGTICLNRFLY